MDGAPISTASAPISMARAISPIMSPAPGPTMPPPTMRCVSRVEHQLGEAYSAPLAMARPGPPEFCGFTASGGSLHVPPRPTGDLRWMGKRRRESPLRRRSSLSRGGFRRRGPHVPPCGTKDGLADDVADGEDVRHIGPHLPVHQMNEAVLAVHGDGLSGADLAALGDRPAGLENHVVARCGPAGAFSPSKLT